MEKATLGQQSQRSRKAEMVSSAVASDRQHVTDHDDSGCATCKAKRLKCDETKPTCQMCEKRNVECGGYKKDFKFKSFDETSFAEGSSSKGEEYGLRQYRSVANNCVQPKIYRP